MKKIFLICLFISSISVVSMKCLDNETDKCSDCFDKEYVLKVANRIAKKRLNDKIDNFEIKFEEEEDSYTIFYMNTEARNDTLMKGGGEIFLRISKKDCKVIDYKKFK